MAEVPIKTRVLEAASEISNLPADTNAQLALKADLTGSTFTGAITAPNLSGTNTGDETAGGIKTKYESNADTNAFTDAEKTNLGNQTGTNTGDQTSIVGITGTKAQFNAAVTDGDIVYAGDNVSSLANDAGYTSNTGTVTPNSTDTFTNKSGNISQWTNNAGYVTSGGVTERFSANLSTIINPLPNVQTQILYDTEDIDSGNNFSASQYTAPSNGDYYFNGNVAVQNLTAGDKVVLYLVVNAVVKSSGILITATGGAQSETISFSKILPLLANDVVRMDIVNLTASRGNTLSGTNGNVFEGYKLN